MTNRETIVLTGVPNEDNGTLTHALENALEEGFLDEHDLHIHTGWCADDFDPDNLGACPHCDGTELSVLDIEENIYKVTDNGDPVYVERGPESALRTNVYCTDCHTHLYRHAIDHVRTE